MVSFASGDFPHFIQGEKKTRETDEAVAAKQVFTVLQCTEKKAVAVYLQGF